MFTSEQSGFDDAGNKVPVTSFDFTLLDGGQDESQDSENRSSREIVTRMAQWLARENASPDEIGLRLLVFKHLVSPEGTQRQLADRMELDETSVSRRLRELRQMLRSASFFN